MNIFTRIIIAGIVSFLFITVSFAVMSHLEIELALTLKTAIIIGLISVLISFCLPLLLLSWTTRIQTNKTKLIKEFCHSRRLDFEQVKSQKGNEYLVIASQEFQRETTTYLLHLVVADDRVLEADRETYSQNTDKMISYFARFK